jgi:hypothetical protein
MFPTAVPPARYWMNVRSYDNQNLLVVLIAEGGENRGSTRMSLVKEVKLESGEIVACPGVIYLDMNIVVALRHHEDPSLSSVFISLAKQGYVFPYSPAHIEEIAVVARTTADEKEADIRVNDNLDFLARLSRHIEIIRGSEKSDPTRFRRECPSDCMERVLDHYWLTHVSEAAAEAVRKSQGDGTDVPCPLDILHLESMKPLIEDKLRNQGLTLAEIPKGPLLGSDHDKLQRAIDSLFNALSAAGYCREKRKKTRSAIHDVTHAIYGVLADVFVTDDGRFRSKLQAVYHYLQAKTEVLSKEEFIGRFSVQPLDQA